MGWGEIPVINKLGQIICRLFSSIMSCFFWKMSCLDLCKFLSASPLPDPAVLQEGDWGPAEEGSLCCYHGWEWWRQSLLRGGHWSDPPEKSHYHHHRERGQRLDVLQGQLCGLWEPQWHCTWWPRILAEMGQESRHRHGHPKPKGKCKLLLCLLVLFVTAFHYNII